MIAFAKWRTLLYWHPAGLIHRKVAEALVALYAHNLEPHHLALGRHYGQGEVGDKAVHFLHRACKAASSRSASREAVACLEQALDALSHLPENSETRRLAIDLRLDLQVPLNNLGEIERQLGYLRDAESLAEALGDLRRTGLVAVYMAVGLWTTGHLEEAAASGEQALAIARTLGDVGLQAQANSRVGQAYQARGEYRRAIAAFQRNVDALMGDLQTERFGMPSAPAVMSRTWMGGCLAGLGEFPAAMAVGEEAVRMAEAAMIGSASASGSCMSHGFTSVRAMSSEPCPWLEWSLDNSRRFNHEAIGLMAAIWLGVARTACGDTAAALPLLEQASERAASIGFAAVLPGAFGALGEGYLLAGRLAEAQLTAGRMLEMARAAGSRHSEAEALRILGDVHARMKPVEAGQAEASYREALAIAEPLGTRPLVAHCHLGLGKLYRRTSNSEQAREHLTTAITMYREMDMRFYLEQAEAAMRDSG